METRKLNVYEKLAKVREVVPAVKKDKQGFGYKYPNIEEILAKVTGAMNTQGLSLLPLIMPGTLCVEKVVTVNTKMDKQGQSYDSTTSEYLVRGDMTYRWVDNENGDYIDIPWAMTGAQSDPSQAFGSALTYSERYFLVKYFQIAAVDNDPDTYRSKQKEAEAAEDLAVAKSIIEKLHTEVLEFLAANPAKRDDFGKLAKKYHKSGDYFKITNPELATKLYQEFTEFKTSKKEGK